ncbi:DUF1987 domain-containing protein [Halodesulfovibrio spirochaetisodalis]|uniref:SiaC family regulatory phosphoprotein domain-containing protein n=1 Tax=Halodesulfovibrio spirochaetisodalis TaxID=1560234 RepID=A0A1B7XDJ7_9BACT|nr:DUF1987 domain-containing protein [Halodesulfovibrio spirochaetisodalis]OBQ52132.1 hypothetical protein SP90_08115 [Halodesulfovibrio spirochaetisodalis]
MDKFVVEATKSTPKICLNPVTHMHEISGESYPENCSTFYGPVFNWFKEYLVSAKGSAIKFSIDILYFNSSSSKAFMELFEMLDTAASSGTKIAVDWRYHEDNEVALECGEDFMEEVESVSFNLVSYS